MRSDSICLSLSGLFHVAQCPPGPSMLLQMATFPSCLWPVEQKLSLSMLCFRRIHCATGGFGRSQRMSAQGGSQGESWSEGLKAWTVRAQKRREKGVSIINDEIFTLLRVTCPSAKATLHSGICHSLKEEKSLSRMVYINVQVNTKT